MVLKLHESTSQLEDTGTGVFYVASFWHKIKGLVLPFLIFC